VPRAFVVPESSQVLVFSKTGLQRSRIGPAPPGEPPAAAGRAAGRRGRRRPGSADSPAMMLAVLGREVRTAGGGAEAVGPAAARRPDAMLLDIGMPRPNGHDACRRIRAEPRGRASLMVAPTGWGREEDRRRTREAGFDHHPLKPADPAAVGNLPMPPAAAGGPPLRPPVWAARKGLAVTPAHTVDPPAATRRRPRP
jgi:CheY-like chemotaxis protein